jgi:hypothetical protein
MMSDELVETLQKLGFEIVDREARLISMDGQLFKVGEETTIPYPEKDGERVEIGTVGD